MKELFKIQNHGEDSGKLLHSFSRGNSNSLIKKTKLWKSVIVLKGSGIKKMSLKKIALML